MSRVQWNLRGKKKKVNRKEFVLDISSLLDCNTGPVGHSIIPPLPYLHDLGTGCSDFYLCYPIDMNVRAHDLFDQRKTYFHE